MRREGWGFIVFMLVLAWWIHSFSWRMRELEQRVALSEVRDAMEEAVHAPTLVLPADRAIDSTPPDQKEETGMDQGVRQALKGAIKDALLSEAGKPWNQCGGGDRYVAEEEVRRELHELLQESVNDLDGEADG